MRLDRYDQGGYAGGGITENGGNISGPLVLAGNPSQTLEAVPKQYVDAYFNSLNASNLTAGTLAAARLPNFTGDLQSVAGTSQLTLANSGITPGEYGKVTVNAKGIVTSGGDISDTDIPFGLGWEKINPATLPSTLAGYGITNAVSVSGGTLTGFLSVTNQPTLGTHVATKQYVDALVSSGGIAVGDILRKPYSNTPVGFLKCNGAEVDKTTFADLYAVIGDQYKDYTVPGAGVPWEQQYDINFNDNSIFNQFTTETSLGFNYAVGCWAVTKNRVYLFGGFNTTGSSLVSTVYTAPINADGSIGTWAFGTALPAAVGYTQCVVVKNKLYVLGGSDNNSGSNILNSVYYAQINSDGTLGAWVTASNLPSGFCAGQAFVTKNKLHLIGGYNGEQILGITNCYTASIDSDGTLGAWSSATSLITGVYWSKIVVTKNRVHLLGGEISGTNNTSNIQTAVINADGTLGTWSVSGTLPNAISHSKIIVCNSRVYLLGGYTGSVYLSTVYTAPINDDGTLGSWVLTNITTPVNYLHNAVFVTKNRVYLIGGWHNGVTYNTVYTAPINGGLNDYSPYYTEDTTNYLMPGSGRPWEQQYQINTSQTGNLTGWTASQTLPIAITRANFVVTKNRVYMIGGYDASGPVASVFTATINTDGSLGTWTSTTSLPTELDGASVIVFKNRVYLIGGYNRTIILATVHVAPINADGTLGTWSTTTSLPIPLYFHSSLVTKNRLYVLGGTTTGSVAGTTVYSCVINSNGSLGTWSLSSNALPYTMSGNRMCVTKNRVYLISGHINGVESPTIYAATINADGILGAWYNAGSFPLGIHGHYVFVTKNIVYIIGGHNSSSLGTIKTVYYTFINEDGTLGSWIQGTNLPETRHWLSVFSTYNTLYVAGGLLSGAGEIQNSCFKVTISSSQNDNSPYYDGTIIPVEPVNSSTKFTLPDLTTDDPFGSYSYIKY